MYNPNSIGGGPNGNSINGMNGGGDPLRQLQPAPSLSGFPHGNNSFPTSRRPVSSMSRRQPGPPGGSLPLDASMQELFGQGANPFARRTSGPFPDGMGDILSKRDSLDSTTAVLDACIFDLTRRRMSMAMGGGQRGVGNDQSHGGVAGGGGGVNQGTGPRGQMDHSNILPGGSTGNPMGNMHSHHGGGGHPQNYAASSIAAKQQLLQQQQLDLELQQKKLEMQRQQLFSGMQDFSMQAAASQQTQGGGSMIGGGGIDSGGMRRNMQEPLLYNALCDPQDRNGSIQPQQQWWICQVCNSKAFASRDEAMHHEAICQEGQHHMNYIEPPRVQQQELHVHLQRPRSYNHHQSSPHPNFGMDLPEELNMESNGPFSTLHEAIPLAMLSDKDWLTPLHCFVRRHCVQVFCASSADVQTPSKGKRKPVLIGQVGIRCYHCHNSSGPAGLRERGSVYYPTTISSIYNATMNLLQRHLSSCSAVPPEIMDQYVTLKGDDARSGTSKKYWVESALSLGLVDTPNGIRFSALRPPPLPQTSRQQRSTGRAVRRNSNDFFSTTSNTISDLPLSLEDPNPMSESPSLENDDIAESNALSDTGPLVSSEDKSYATAFSYKLLGQMQPCVFTEADRLGKRKGLPPGFVGLACRHCFGGYGSGRFFPSSIKTLSDTSKTLNVLYNHMMRCRKCPSDVRDCLEKLRNHHDDERAKMKFGSQKAFFAKIWGRLHDGINTPQAPPTAGMKRKMASYEPPLSKRASFEPPNLSHAQGFSPARMQQMMNSVAAQQQEHFHHQHQAQMQQNQIMHHHEQQHHQQLQMYNHSSSMQQHMPPQLPPNLAHLQQQMMGGGLDVLSRQATENDMKYHHRSHM